MVGDNPETYVEDTNLLFVSIDGLITDIAWRVSREGFPVRYYVETDYARDVGEGFVPKTDAWRDELEWADVVVFDDTWGGGEHAQQLREEGMAVIGGSAFTDQLEEDRELASNVMSDMGLDVIPENTFDDYESAIRHVRANPAAYVIKPCGEVQNFKELLYVGRAEDGRDVIAVLERYREKWGDEIDRFQLQRRVEGVEISVCGFFNGQKFIEPVSYTFEHKPLFPGDVGPMTGEMGTSMFWTEPTRLFDETIRPFAPRLREEGYHGPFDINCIVTEDSVRPLEMTPRFGYPQIAIQEEGLKTPVSKLLLDLANGRDPDLEVHRGFQVGARICVPPFPYDDLDVFNAQSRDAPVWFEQSNGGIPDGVHLEDLKHTNGEYRVAGETGEILVITGRGESMEKAQQEMYAMTDQIIAPNMYYRNDIGDRWYEEGDLLLSWGYI